MSKLFIPYIMGNKDFIQSLKIMDDNGADFIEIGLPFSDPVADGPTIMKAGQEAIQQGMNVNKIIDQLIEHKDDIKTPYLFMTYYNLIDYYGVERFIKRISEANVYGLIIPDLPFELGEKFKEKLKGSNVKLISLIAMTSSEDRIKKIAEKAEGFIYTVTMNGSTGDDKGFHEGLKNKIAYIQKHSNVPVVCGFGIKTVEHAHEFKSFSDGIVIGSEIVKRLQRDQINDTISYLQSIRSALDEA
ncbi:tryptophan synthase subunit alpha [Mammaliicoccus stepanovicii]|uniref:Tryptophan synthase alpha chain n=1 Tax=Mammaliicoccus stepanovicii TaxID=643214 RepID=A0A239ZB88_9STAP|nr:tryptophan synthase subunit alpha [Mammaliicoccus stepanovicii]PNZ74124.1 tryptophan synthase subunit alpha [Mammaliicoccus stepanovicii]GGI42100.1 tryptophan synthase alpha chain [Mammaliicoccus stepanovicii]SNV68449.1 tryptophan synthase subunit alpha [Mammaliicoccus stepanovicii]